jgi:hypothetical protein
LDTVRVSSQIIFDPFFYFLVSKPQLGYGNGFQAGAWKPGYVIGAWKPGYVIGAWKPEYVIGAWKPGYVTEPGNFQPAEFVLKNYEPFSSFSPGVTFYLFFN